MKMWFYMSAEKIDSLSLSLFQHPPVKVQVEKRMWFAMKNKSNKMLNEYEKQNKTSFFRTFEWNLHYFRLMWRCGILFASCETARCSRRECWHSNCAFQCVFFFLLLPQNCSMFVNLFFLYIVNTKRDWARYLSLNIVNGQQQFRVDDANTSSEIIIEWA